MEPVSPVLPGHDDLPEHQIGKNQPEYGNLPALCVDQEKGIILSRWKLSPEEIEIIRETGDLYVFIHTFNKPLQPISIQVEEPKDGDQIPEVVSDPADPTINDLIRDANLERNGPIKIFHRDRGDEFYAAKNIDQAREAARRHLQLPEASEIIMVEVQDDALDSIVYVKDDFTTQTFRERLNRMLASGKPFPRLFAMDDHIQT